MKDEMDALTTMLAGGPPQAGLGIEHLCKQSAGKAVEEVLAAIFRHARERDGIVTLHYTQFSRGALDKIVRDAIDACCD